MRQWWTDPGCPERRILAYTGRAPVSLQSRPGALTRPQCGGRMTDDTTDKEQPGSADPGRSGTSLGSLRTTLAKRDARGRPVAVYGILGIGVATLLVLMLVIYFWSADRDNPEQIICTTITPQRAQDAVRDGEVERLTLAYDQQVESSTDRRWGPVLARIDYVDGQCANLPQGLVNQTDVLSILGAIAFYNQTTESAQVEITYNAMTELDAQLFTTPTTVPSPTQVPTETPAGIESPVSTPQATPTEAPATEEPVASPAATPRGGTPEDMPTRTPTATATATP
jgi:hypothetical protein